MYPIRNKDWMNIDENTNKYLLCLGHGAIECRRSKMTSTICALVGCTRRRTLPSSGSNREATRGIIVCYPSLNVRSKETRKDPWEKLLMVSVVKYISGCKCNLIY